MELARAPTLKYILFKFKIESLQGGGRGVLSVFTKTRKHAVTNGTIYIKIIKGSKIFWEELASSRPLRRRLTIIYPIASTAYTTIC